MLICWEEFVVLVKHTVLECYWTVAVDVINLKD